MTAPVLTITIPTHDRPEKLAATLTALAPQLGSGVHVVVLDNASTPPAKDALDAIGLCGSVDIVRNIVNIGAPANILRCFEVADTPWMWILPDDDELLDDAVSTVLEEVSATDAVVHAFPVIAPLGVSASGVGWREFVDSGIRWTDILYLPVPVLRREAFLPHLRHGYAIGIDGYVSVMRRGLGADGRFVLHDRPLVKWVPPSGDQKWSELWYMLSAPLILDDIEDDEERRALAAAIGDWPGHSPAALGRLLSHATVTGSSPGFAKYLLDQVFWRFQYYGRSPRKVAEWLLWRNLVRHPRLLEQVRAARHADFRALARRQIDRQPEPQDSIMGDRL